MMFVNKQNIINFCWSRIKKRIKEIGPRTDSLEREIQQQINGEKFLGNYRNYGGKREKHFKNSKPAQKKHNDYYVMGNAARE